MIKQRLTKSRIETESDLWRAEIESELVLDLVQFALEKGFNFEEIIDYVDIQTSLVDVLKTDSSYLNLTQFTRIFYDFLQKVRINGPREEKNLKEFIDFETESMLKNFNLLRFVFRTQRDSLVEKDSKSVQAPNYDDYERMKMKEAKSYDQWLKDEKLAALSANERNLHDKYLEDSRNIAEEERSARNIIEYIRNDAYGSEIPLDEEVS